MIETGERLEQAVLVWCWYLSSALAWWCWLSVVAGQGLTSRDPRPRCAGGLGAPMLAQGAAQVHGTIPDMWLHGNPQNMWGNKGMHTSRRGVSACNLHSLGSGMPKARHV